MPVRIWIALLGLLAFGALPALALSGRTSPSSAQPGDPVTVTGSDFTPDRPCHLHFTTGAVPSDFTNQVGTCNLDSTGRASGSFSVPEVPTGSYTVWICTAPGNAPCNASSSDTLGIPFAVQGGDPPPTTTTTLSTTTSTTSTAPSSTSTSTTTAPGATTSTTAVASATPVDDDPSSPSGSTTVFDEAPGPAGGPSDPSSDTIPEDQQNTTEPTFAGRFLQDAPQVTTSETAIVDPPPTGVIVASVAAASAAALAAVVGLNRVSGRVRRPPRNG